MPTYEYRCPVCSHRFELRQSFQDPPVSQCPKCHSSAVRIISRVGVVFKGSGWYSTDHRSSRSASSPSTAEAEESESGGSESTDSGGEKKQAEPSTTTTAAADG